MDEFLENEDYKFCSPVLGSKGRGGHNITDYSLTLDMAKELSMVENNKIGIISRKYFIAIDKAFKARRLWIDDIYFWTILSNHGLINVFSNMLVTIYSFQF